MLLVYRLITLCTNVTDTNEFIRVTDKLLMLPQESNELHPRVIKSSFVENCTMYYSHHLAFREIDPMTFCIY